MTEIAFNFLRIVSMSKAFNMDHAMNRCTHYVDNKRNKDYVPYREKLSQYLENEHYESHTPHWQVSEWAAGNWK